MEKTIPKPPKPVDEMTPEELDEFRNSLNCDNMGNVDVEGTDNA